MRILVLGSRVPWPLHDGGAMATYGLLKNMAECGAEITFFCFNTSRHFVPQNEIEIAFPFCKVITSPIDNTIRFTGALVALIRNRNYNISRFYSRKAETALEKLLQEQTFDLIQFEGLYSTTLFDVAQRFAPEIQKVLRQHNVEFRIWENLFLSEKNLIRRMYVKHLYRGIRRYELHMLKRFKYIVPISPTDEEFMKELHPEAVYFTCPAGIEIYPEHPEPVSQNSLYHIGSMEWLPNREGITWFLKEVWPKIQILVPNAQFHIAGKGLNANDPEFVADGVVNHGEVQDAREFHGQYSMMVVPLLSASGIRMKTLEAMAAGNAVVTTQMGLSGIPAMDEREVAIADDVESFVEKAVLLLRNPEMAKNMGKTAREWVAERYSGKAIAQSLIRFYNDISQR